MSTFKVEVMTIHCMRCQKEVVPIDVFRQA